MQRVLLDRARARGAEKRGGAWRRVPLDDASGPEGAGEADLLALHEALEKMSAIDPRQAKVMRLRVVDRDWKMGLAWLRRELAGRDE
jgi:hypothetical protein